MTKVWERARGHWDAILAALGHEDALTKKHARCPACGGKDRYRYVGDPDGGFFCGDTRGNGFQLLQHLRGTDFKQTADLVDSIIGRNPEMERVDDSAYRYIQSIQRAAEKAERSSYLASRGLEVPPGIRFIRSLGYFEDGKEPRNFAAMLAPITRGGELLSYQATYLANGKKADVPTPRKTLPGKPISGGACELYPAAECMGIAEGVETAIAAKQLFGTPCWASLSTSGMRSWQWPAIAKEIWIFADNDANYAGHAAAYHLANRIAKEGLEVTVMFPKDRGDWNDVLKNLPMKQASRSAGGEG